MFDSWKNLPEMERNGAGKFSPTFPDIVDILGDMDLNFDNCFSLTFLGFHISRFPEIWPGQAL